MSFCLHSQVLIDKTGTMLVRVRYWRQRMRMSHCRVAVVCTRQRLSFVEASLRRTPGVQSARARDHLLLSYKTALLAVLEAQFDDREFADGMQVRRCCRQLWQLELSKSFVGQCSITAFRHASWTPESQTPHCRQSAAYSRLRALLFARLCPHHASSEQGAAVCLRSRFQISLDVAFKSFSALEETNTPSFLAGAAGGVEDGGAPAGDGQDIITAGPRKERRDLLKAIHK